MMKSIYFSNKSKKDLKSIIEDTKETHENKVIKQILKNLSIDKNILVFLPYEYLVENMGVDKKYCKTYNRISL